jgi:hypothetical protein
LIKNFFSFSTQENTDSASWPGALTAKELYGAELNRKPTSLTEPLRKIPAFWQGKKDEGAQKNPLSAMLVQETKRVLIGI